MADCNKKKVNLLVAGTEFNFQVGIDEFTQYQNEFTPLSKVAPSENFLMRCVNNDQREELTGLCDAGYAVDIAGAVAGEFKPEISITVKK